VPPPDPALTRPGDILLGKYRVENVLGRGGMGIVVAARHLSLDDRVAIKFLLPERLGDEESVLRFVREARAAVRIRSQHIARVTDVGTMESGAPYMVMEYLEGKNLSAVVAQGGALPIPLAIDLVLQASEALAEAHAQEIVHRDVKPSNLFLSHHADGSPCLKVLDFGISKMPGAQDHALTRTGAVFGSPFYMSPEQLRSARDVDARTDIYSLGVVLYELLTGRVPFTADDLPQLVYKIMNEAPVSPRARRAEIPEILERAVLVAMARDREARFQTIADLAAAIAPHASSRSYGSAERIGGILRSARARGEREAAPAASEERNGAGVTAHLVEPATLKDDLQSSIASFGATQRHSPSSRQVASRGRLRPIAIGLGVVAIGIATLAFRSSRHVSPPTSPPAVPVAEGAETAESAATELPSPAPIVPVVSAIVSAPLPPSVPAPPLRSASPRTSPTPASSSPAPRARRVDKDPFKRDVF
jgi:serine/threonine-protein kinase